MLAYMNMYTLFLLLKLPVWWMDYSELDMSHVFILTQEKSSTYFDLIVHAYFSIISMQGIINFLGGLHSKKNKLNAKGTTKMKRISSLIKKFKSPVASRKFHINVDFNLNNEIFFFFHISWEELFSHSKNVFQSHRIISIIRKESRRGKI